jgi:pimeloyl-ACP methyl ester carboxylesterase
VAPAEPQRLPDLDTAAARLQATTPSLSSGLALYLAARLTEPAGQDGALQWRWDPALTTRRIARLPMDTGTYLDMLRTLPVPAVWIRGRNSHANRESDLVRLRQALARVQEIAIAGGHNLHLEAPMAIADLIADLVSDQIAEHGLSGASSPSAIRRYCQVGT